MAVTVEQETKQLNVSRPHVVILGAGASIACCPSGDANGTRLPLMNDFVDVVGLDSDLRALGIPLSSSGNIEEVYSELTSRGCDPGLLAKLETKIHAYFARLCLPKTATLYDRLVLALRSKDVIATFNWDPFLVQALNRNASGNLPRVLFLHGSVAAGGCPEHRVAGNLGKQCPECKKTFMPSKLLYPIRNKDYASDGFIAGQWEALRVYLRDAFCLTIFGYGAPASDAAAVDLMKTSWKGNSNFKFAQVEIIDIREEKFLSAAWSPFLFSHHFDYRKTFEESWMFNHPRRSCEALFNMTVMAEFTTDCPMYPGSSLADLQESLRARIELEVD